MDNNIRLQNPEPGDCRLMGLATSDELVSWTEVHQSIQRLGRDRAAHDYEEGRQLLLASRISVHRRLGFASFTEYVERFIGHSPKMTRERLRVAESLERLPRLAEELREGRLSWSVVRELTRISVPETEATWIEHAMGKTAREVESKVSGHLPGDRPDEAPTLEPRTRKLVLEVEASTHALWREARQRLMEETGEPLDDDTLLALLCQKALGSGDDGRAGHQIAYTVCEGCGAATQTGGGEAVPVEREAIEAARCDAQHIGRVDADRSERAAQDIPPATRRLVLARHHGRCAVPGCTRSLVDLHHIDLRSEGGGHDPERLVPLCRGGHHKMAHVGRLVVTGIASRGLRFFHADGSPYGAPAVHAGRTELLGSAYEILRSMGYRDRETRRALDGIASCVTAHMGLDQVVPMALAAFPSPGS